MPKSKMKRLSDSNFEVEVLTSEVPTMVCFSAPWCETYHEVAPHLHEIASEFEGKVQVAEVNVDDNSQSSETYNVTGLPNVTFFKNGQMVERIVGAVPKKHLVDALTRMM